MNVAQVAITGITVLMIYICEKPAIYWRSNTRRLNGRCPIFKQVTGLHNRSRPGNTPINAHQTALVKYVWCCCSCFSRARMCEIRSPESSQYTPHSLPFIQNIAQPYYPLATYESTNYHCKRIHGSYVPSFDINIKHYICGQYFIIEKAV